jgi:exodeoxyribonuclease VII large subunit
VRVRSVSELTRRIKDHLELGFPAVWVSGEVSNCKRHTSGHVYLSLKDSGAQIRAVIWRSTARGLKFEPEDGLEVIAQGRVTVYEPRGDYQLVIQRLEPKGIGALQLRFEELKKKLVAEGLFDPARKRPLPKLPRKIALVTSPTGAAVRDMIRVLTRRFPPVHVVVVPVLVQGEGAAADVHRGIERAARATGADLVIVGRGGGSLEDLWAFNTEEVVRAVAACPVPIISAVGHEVDTTLSDYAADHRAPTPSAAAEAAVPELRRVLDDLRRIGEAMRERLGSQMRVARLRADAIARSYALRHPAEKLRNLQQRLDDLSHRLAQVIRNRRERAAERVRVAGASLEAMSPLRVLVRGYSITTREEDGVPLTGIDPVRQGDLLATRLHAGRIWSRVEKAEGLPVDASGARGGDGEEG